MLRTTYIPSGEPLSEDFSVLLNGKSAQLSQIRVNALPFFHNYRGFLNTGKERPLDETELASLLSFSASSFAFS